MGTDKQLQYAQTVASLRAEADELFREATAKRKLAAELERVTRLSSVQVVTVKTSPATNGVQIPEITLQHLKDFISNGGTGRPEHIAAKLRTTPERIKVLISQPDSGLSTKDRGWVKLKEHIAP